MKPRKTKPNKRSNSLLNTFIEHIYRLNSSKFFTGLIMLTVNIGSKYITLQLVNLRNNLFTQKQL